MEPWSLAADAALGLLTGILSGLFGVGGGFLLVPGQVSWLGIPLKRAIGNSLGAVLLTGVVGTLAHGQLGTVRWLDAGVLIAGGLVGVWLGTRVLRGMAADRLRVGMQGFLVALAAAMAVTAGTALLKPTGPPPQGEAGGSRSLSSPTPRQF